MIKLIVVTICIVLLTASCQQKENNKIVNPANAQSKDSSNSFPIMEMLKEDINDVQKIPYFIYKKTSCLCVFVPSCFNSLPPWGIEGATKTNHTFHSTLTSVSLFH
jgi:hypothetical protein